MRHNSVHLRTIMGVREVEAVSFGDFPRRVLWLVGRGSQERPVHPIEAVRSTVVAECLTAISLRVRCYRDELNLALHRRDVDHRLDLGDTLGVKRAHIRTVDVDEVQDHDLATKVRQPNRFAVSVPKGEIRSIGVNRLKVLLLIE